MNASVSLQCHLYVHVYVTLVHKRCGQLVTPEAVEEKTKQEQEEEQQKESEALMEWLQAGGVSLQCQ